MIPSIFFQWHVATSLEKEKRKGCDNSPPTHSYRHTTLGECLVCDSGSYSSFCHYLESSLEKKEKGG